MTDRLKLFIENQGISTSAFEQKISASDGMIRRAIRNKTDIQGKWFSKISDNYPDLNLEWLITGKGSMLKSECCVAPLQQSQETEEETRPRIPVDAAAGSLTVIADGITLDNCEQLPVIKAFARYDFTIFAQGDSMEPEYNSGDELACIYIINNGFIQWGRIHVIDTTQGILVKRIFDDGDSIICKSDNPNYPDFRIDKSELQKVALVIGMIRRY